MRIYDGHGRFLRPTDDSLWVGSPFYYDPPRAPRSASHASNSSSRFVCSWKARRRSTSVSALAQIRRRFVHVVAVGRHAEPSVVRI
jgi:hypothetical protein